MINRSDVIFIADNVDSVEDLSDVRAKIKDLGFGWALHAFSGNEGSDEAYLAFEGDGVPYFVMVDRDGIVVKTSYDADEAISFIREQVALSKRGTAGKSGIKNKKWQRM